MGHTPYMISQALPEDVALLKRIGLTVFKDAKHLERVSLGEANGFKNLTVEVSVSCAPAQFWTFRITRKAYPYQVLEFATGSGTLSDFWRKLEPVLEAMDDNMLTVNGQFEGDA